MATNKTSYQGIKDAVIMFFVSALSLFLLIYVGYGEAQRNYYQFLIDEVTAQGKIVQKSMEGFLQGGHPIQQYIGFTTLVRPIMASDEAISAMTAVDRTNSPIFSAGDENIPMLPASARITESREDATDVRRSALYYQVVLPLRDKFETVGSLVITMPRSIVTNRLEESFRSLIFVALGLSIFFAVFAASRGPTLAGHRVPWLPIVYALTFLTTAGIVIGTLISLYSDGAQSKTKAFADTLGQRLGDVVAFNLNIDQFEGLDRMFGDYRRLNPDISAAGLTVNGIVQIHTDRTKVGKPWISDPAAYEYVVDLSRPETSVNVVKVAVALPVDIVYQRVLRTVKNFAALFVASAFLAGLFLQFAGSMQQANRAHLSKEKTKSSGTALDLVKPVFFVAVFLEHLNYPFLAQFVYDITTEAGLSAGFASAPFMAYYLCFALTLIPAGHFSQRFGPRHMMFGGLLLAALGLLGMAFMHDFYTMTIARSIAGIGQGMLFIGVQAYIFATASPDKKTQGAAIIVIGFQGGMISGTAIGSLLVGYLGPIGVFTLGGATAVALALYTVIFVPFHQPEESPSRGQRAAWSSLGHDLAMVLRSLDFLKIMMLIGVPAKAVMTGIIIFALPILLTQMEYAQEDIGQLIMLYAIGVLVSSIYVSRYVDRTGKTDAILFWGTTISGIGLLMIGLTEWRAVAESAHGVTAILIIGVITIGIAHGFITAPVVTRIAETKISETIGINSVTATYRFLERLGHIAGPIIVGQLFLFGGQTTTVVTWVGAAVVLFGLIFILQVQPQRHEHSQRIEQPRRPETVQEQSP